MKVSTVNTYIKYIDFPNDSLGCEFHVFFNDFAHKVTFSVVRDLGTCWFFIRIYEYGFAVKVFGSAAAHTFYIKCIFCGHFHGIASAVSSSNKPLVMRCFLSHHFSTI